MDEPAGGVRLTRAFLAEGSNSVQLERRVRRAELVRVRYGAYATALESDVGLRHRQLMAATLPLLGAKAVLSHGSAAVLHGLPLWGDELDRVHVTRERTSGGRRSRHLYIHTGPLESSDVVEVEQFLVTSLARTVADLGRTSLLDRAVAVADVGLRLGVSRATLMDQACSSRRRRGCGQLRFVVGFADARAESPGESASRLVLHQMQLPPPEPQYEIVDPATGEVLARCDFGWEEHRTVGEFDGLAKYGRLVPEGKATGDILTGEKFREDMIRDRGHEMVRWIHSDLSRPNVLRDRLLRAFARGNRRR